jgi:hypothetical protein
MVGLTAKVEALGTLKLEHLLIGDEVADWAIIQAVERADTPFAASFKAPVQRRKREIVRAVRARGRPPGLASYDRETFLHRYPEEYDAAAQRANGHRVTKVAVYGALGLSRKTFARCLEAYGATWPPT